MKNRLLTLGDLYDYFEKNGKDYEFSTSNTRRTFAVQIPGKAVFEDTSTEGLIKCHVKVCHSKDNKNHLFIDDDVMKDALSSFKMRPILANIREVDGQLEFGGHDFTEYKDPETGEIKREYEEQIVGITSATEEPYIEYDSEEGKNYVHVEGYLFDDYNDAKSIIEREGGVSDVSMEIDIQQLSYNAIQHSMAIQKFRNTGTTILGVTDDGEEIDPAMVGANITLADFQVDANASVFSDSKFVEKVDELMKMLATFQDTQSQKKGGKTDGMNKFEELLAKYSVTADQVTFEHENMTDEELEAKFAEVFEDGGDSGDGTDASASDGGDDGDSSDGSTDSDSGDDTSDDNDDSDDASTDSTEPVLGASGSDDTSSTDDSVAGKKKVYSITDPTGKTFSVSLNDKIGAVSQLVNATYAEEDNDYYFCTVYDNSVVMESWCTGKLYRQSYTDENGEFSLTGDRVEVFTEYLTAEEQNTLKVIRGEYAELKEYKESNEAAKATAAKEEVFAKFSEILKDNAEFEELKKGDFSAEELELRCNALVGAKQMETFAVHDDNKAHKVLFDLNGKSETKKPYGGLFDDVK